MLVIVTVTPGSTPPDVSVTVPSIDAVGGLRLRECGGRGQRTSQ